MISEAQETSSVTEDENLTTIDFVKNEEEVLKFWKQHNIFAMSLHKRKDAKPFVFYDGPPFATGLPHYGHLLASIIKDVVPRYWTMNNHYVERRFGWDCHGLPIEYEIDKVLGISGRAGVQKFGVARYNQECRAIVDRYATEWEQTITRIGRWVDFKNDYKTMQMPFMESVWWVFKQLWDKGLIYRGLRVMPYSTAIATPLSNFEAGSNYKDVQDPALTVCFKSVTESHTSFLVWTTTPWTLPSNLALAFGPDILYVCVLNEKDQKKYILAKNRLEFCFGKEKFTILKEFSGREFVETTPKYEPLFSYFTECSARGAFKIILSDHVTDTDGTGIVHMAPAFGEDDFNACLREGLILKDGTGLIMPLDEEGRFNQQVSDFAGQHVKDADKEIIKKLKDEGKVWRHDTLVHSYPFCPRSDTPLIYRSIQSWFVNVEKIKDQMIEANHQTHWVPENLRDGRFGNWLENARDWNISRNRFWGNPLPIWQNDSTGAYHCVGSHQELEDLTGKKISDLHMEFLESLTFSKVGEEGVYKRVPEVLDCWFESGAMPYAQNHYPFENKLSFEKAFPAQFIAEGLDQTRGWFYTLTVLGVALFGKTPFQNVIVNGMILAEDGKKMSKRLKNYPDPQQVLNTYGADALRLYLISSPAVRAEELKFAESGVKDIVRRVLLKWWHAFSFFNSYARIDNFKPQAKKSISNHPLDVYILSALNSLLTHIQAEMGQYHLFSVAPRLLEFIEDLTNIYIRMNRKRFWSEGQSLDKQNAFETLFEVLKQLNLLMAPFTPFLAETLFQNLKKINPSTEPSVHLELYPQPSLENKIDIELEQGVRFMQRIIVLARHTREQASLKIKIPLQSLTIVDKRASLKNSLRSLLPILSEELNVRQVLFDEKLENYVDFTIKANGATLGKRIGKKFPLIQKSLKELSAENILGLEAGNVLSIEDEAIKLEDVVIQRQIKEHLKGVASDFGLTIALNLDVQIDQLEEAWAREFVSAVQKKRKDLNFNLADRIHLVYFASEPLLNALNRCRDYICEQVLAVEYRQSPSVLLGEKDVCMIENYQVEFAMSRITHD